MFHHILVALDNRTSAEVENVITDPPADRPYSALKEALMEAYEKTPAQKDREFMSIRSLGNAAEDETPASTGRTLLYHFQVEFSTCPASRSKQHPGCHGGRAARCAREEG